jgi:signal transduction histidine kinase
MAENFPESTREGELAAGDNEVAGLRTEVAELRASRERLVMASDAERRLLERELHGGVQQHLVALSVRLQLAASTLDSDPAAAKALLEETSRDVQDALDEAARLAQRIYAPLLELGLAAALRAAVVSAGVTASVDVSAGSGWPPEVLHTVYACWLEALEHADDAGPAITVREDDGALAFEVVRDAPGAELDALRDRVDALGGTVRVEAESGGGVRVSGSLPPSH